MLIKTSALFEDFEAREWRGRPCPAPASPTSKTPETTSLEEKRILSRAKGKSKAGTNKACKQKRGAQAGVCSVFGD